MATTPEVRIKFSHLIYRTIATRLYSCDKPGISLMAPNTAGEKAERYRAEWRHHESKILTGMCTLFDLTFYKPIIDVYLSPWVPTISAPILISLRAEPDEFVDILAHELIHALITDNTRYPGDAIGPILDQLYPSFDRVTKDHVLVYAGLKHIYLTVLQEPRRLDRDIAYCHSEISHMAAWDYVNERDHLTVIDEFKRTYRNSRRLLIFTSSLRAMGVCRVGSGTQYLCPHCTCCTKGADVHMSQLHMNCTCSRLALDGFPRMSSHRGRCFHRNTAVARQRPLHLACQNKENDGKRSRTSGHSHRRTSACRGYVRAKPCRPQ